MLPLPEQSRSSRVDFPHSLLPLSGCGGYLKQLTINCRIDLKKWYLSSIVAFGFKSMMTSILLNHYSSSESTNPNTLFPAKSFNYTNAKCPLPSKVQQEARRILWGLGQMEVNKTWVIMLQPSLVLERLYEFVRRYKAAWSRKYNMTFGV